MTVKSLREELNKIPEGLTQEEFDDLIILFPYEEGFVSPCEGESGLIEFGEPCDENGEPLEEDPTGWNSKAFALFPHDYHESTLSREQVEKN